MQQKCFKIHQTKQIAKRIDKFTTIFRKSISFRNDRSRQKKKISENTKDKIDMNRTAYLTPIEHLRAHGFTKINCILSQKTSLIFQAKLYKVCLLVTMELN